jgi:hypothetical protein
MERIFSPLRKNFDQGLISPFLVVVIVKTLL